MFSYAVYKVVHLVGILMVFMALGGLSASVINNIGKTNNLWRKQLAITHGVGLLVSLVGGFGLLARLGIVQNGLPGWIIAKLCIWLLFGLLTAVLYRKPNLARPLWILIIIFGGWAAYLAGSKPF
jgi:hypothetical protein